MSAERLRDAVDAYRDATREESAAAGDTRARIRTTLVRRARRKRTATAVGGAFAMLFVATSAWAYTTGRIERWLEPAPETPAPSIEPAEHSERSLGRRDRVEDETPEMEEPLVQEAPIASAEVPMAVEEPAPIEAAPVRPVAIVRREPRATTREREPVEAPAITPSEPGPAAQPAEVVAEPEPDPFLSRFRAAQAAHDAHEPGAIALWTEYIDAAPPGRLVLEARYNRALARVRAGQYDQALRELAPFASGEYGNYRREEATRLVEALRARQAARPSIE
jgi:hypothetical protein